MQKLILAISLFLAFTFVDNLAFADNKQEEIFWGYKKSQTISGGGKLRSVIVIGGSGRKA